MRTMNVVLEVMQLYPWTQCPNSFGIIHAYLIGSNTTEYSVGISD